MTYSSFYCLLTDDALVQPTLTYAMGLAHLHDAHLDTLCMGVDHSPASYDLAGSGVAMQEHALARAREDAETLVAHARRLLEAGDIRWSLDHRMGQLGGLGGQVARHARYSDMVILPQPYGETRGAELEVITEAVLFDANTPALILPAEPGPAPTALPRRIVLGWNESTEALNAARAAMPLLRQAEKVHVVVIDPPSQSADRSAPGACVSQYLARHDIRVEVDVLARSLPSVSDVLNRHAADVEADLIVIGAYSHSRLREAVFGGVTRSILTDATLPVLMAH